MEAAYTEFDMGKTEFGAMAWFISSCCQRTRGIAEAFERASA